jgi:hypothetical protein
LRSSIPHETFRDKVYETMEENLTTMRKEVGIVPPPEEGVAVL